MYARQAPSGEKNILIGKLFFWKIKLKTSS